MLWELSCSSDIMSQLVITIIVVVTVIERQRLGENFPFTATVSRPRVDTHKHIYTTQTYTILIPTGLLVIYTIEASYFCVSFEYE
jgi:hypothetical protein